MTTIENTNGQVDTELEGFDEVSAEPRIVTTVLDFFRYLNFWTYVQLGNGPTYVYVDCTTDEDGNLRPVLIHARYLSEHQMSVSELQEENNSDNDYGWHTVMVDGVDKTTTAMERLAIRHIRTYRTDIEELATRAESAEANLTATQKDFATVNEKLNEFAVDKGYCSDYEMYIGQWNEELTVSKLYGRPRTFYIYVKFEDFPASVDALPVPVEARSEDEARKMLKDMTPGQMIQAALNNGSYLYGYNPLIQQSDGTFGTQED